MIPATFTFINVYKENKINTQVSAFIKNEIKTNPSLLLLDYDKNIKEKIIYVSFFNEITEATENDLKNELNNNKEYLNLTDFTLDIKGSDTKSFDLITTAYKEKRQELDDSKKINEALRKEIEDLRTMITSLNQNIEQKSALNNEKAIAFSRISKDAKIRYNEIQEIGFANMLSSKDFIKVDTIPLVTIKWSPIISDSIITIKEIELRSWLQKEMKLDTLFIKRDK
jgi:hypothetical protein